MKNEDLLKTLSDLLNLPGENEMVEFKEAKNTYDFNKLGKYFSAIANEANLSGKRFGWVVFGIENKSRNIVGTQFRPNRKDLDSPKSEIANKTTNRITFIEIYELQVRGSRVVMFQIPAAPKGIPVAWEGHYYGRDDEEINALNVDEFERIRSQALADDWSAVTIPDATIDDLDPIAIQVARLNYMNKFPSNAIEVDKWSDEAFLNKAKLLIKGKVTRTAIILLGKEESEHFINPAEVKIRWILKDSSGNERDYAIFGPPMLLAVDKAFAKIRNLKYRYSHQDYTKSGRINLIESDDQLMFSNVGSFIPGTVEKVVIDDSPEEQYRNKFLVTAMFNLKMVDTVGGGIRKIFNFQRSRFFPLPDYDLRDGKVRVTLTGKILNQDYARVLANNTDLSLEEIILLDKVQKKIALKNEEEKNLKAKGLIEGRKPNFFISQNVAEKIGKKAEYSKNKGLDDSYYMDFIEKSIREHGYLNRKDIDELLCKKLPEWMNDKQKKIKVNNLLSTLRKQKRIKNAGSDKAPKWVLQESQ
jgi:ATP-dependent DNA helicase RecG